jgi:inner membrane protein involved in colicin E2 resistance
VLTDHRKVALVVVPLLLLAAFVEHDGVSIALSVVALALALVALIAILRARRAARRDSP